MRIWSYLLIILVFSSCSEVKKKMIRTKKVEHQSFLINLGHTYSEVENNVSFPIWFNDTLVKNRKIKSISRHIFPPYDGSEADKQIPIETKSYQFDEKGEVLKFEVDRFYEYVKVGSLTFDYLAAKDEYGYSPVQISNTTEKNEIADQFSIFEKEEYAEKFLVYKGQESGDYLFYLKNKANWGGLSVDSILRPTPNDIVVFGTPMKPNKSYQVENTVNEFNVVKYNYSKGDDFLLKQEINKFPFHTLRSIEYDDKGQCVGFIDSTFSGEKYLTRRNSRFIFEKGLPVKLIHESKSNNAEHGFIQVEEFVYEFMENNKK